MRSNRLLVLCYHGVIREVPSKERYRTRNTVSVDVFERQLRIIGSRFSPVSAAQVLERVEQGTPLPAYPVLIAFDDGFRNNLTIAAPILEKLGIPALVNVATGYIGRDKMLWTQELDERILGWQANTLPMPSRCQNVSVQPENRVEIATSVREICKRLTDDERNQYLQLLRQEPIRLEPWFSELYDFMSWEEVGELHQRGIEIGSHTHDHCILSRLSVEALRNELAQSKALIEQELRVPCPYVTYPNGGKRDYSLTVNDVARQTGYKLAFTLRNRLNRRKLDFEVDRIWIGGSFSHDQFQRCLKLSIDLRDILKAIWRSE